MTMFISIFKKFSLAALVLAIGLVALPAASAPAAGLQDETTPPANPPANRVVPVPARDGVVPVPVRDGIVPVPARDGVVPVPARGNERLEQIWARAQTVFQRQGDRLAKADDFLAKAQPLIDRASQKGWDTSAVQAALNAFAAVIPAAQAAHDPGAAIKTSHNGFDADGNVTDRAAAIETVKSLGQVLKDTRAAMNGTGQALREAVKAFRNAHRPALAPTTP
jgi:hypothetical protein